MAPPSPYDAEAVEARLAPALRGTGEGYQRMLRRIGLRVSVRGADAKRPLARLADQALRRRGMVSFLKLQGERPTAFVDGRDLDADSPAGPAPLDETLWLVKQAYPVDAMVVEGPSIGEHALRLFDQRIVRPNVLLITELHQAPGDALLPDLAALGRAIGRSVDAGTLVLCGEAQADARAAIESATRANGATFVDASPPATLPVPGAEVLTVLERFVRELTDEPMDRDELRAAAAELERTFAWRSSSRAGLEWFDGARATGLRGVERALRRRADPASSPVTFVVHVPLEASSQLAAFLLPELASGFAEHVYAAGPGAGRLAAMLDRYAELVHVLDDDPRRAAEVVDRVADASTSGRLVTLGDARSPLLEAVSRELADEPAPWPLKGPIHAPAAARPS